MRIHQLNKETEEFENALIKRDQLLENLANSQKHRVSETNFPEARDLFYNPLSSYQKFIAQSFLSLDIQSDRVNYLVGKKSGKTIQVKQWGEMEFSPNKADPLAPLYETLSNLRYLLYKVGMNVYVSIFSPDMNIRQIILPKIPKKANLKKAIQIQNRMNLPNFDEDSYWTYEILEEFNEEGAAKLRVLVTTVPGEVISAYLEVLNRAGLKPNKLTTWPLALTTAYRNMLSSLESKDVLIDISSTFTQVCYLVNGKLQYVRNVSIGSKNFQEAIKPENGSLPAESGEPDIQAVSQQTADENKPMSPMRRRLLEKVNEMRAKQNPMLETFLGEIVRSLEFFKSARSEENVQRILLTGSGIQLESILPYLRSRITKSSFTLVPQFDNSATRSVDHGQYFTALGTAFQTNEEFNLLPGEYRRRVLLNNINRVMPFLLSIALVTMIILTFSVQRKNTSQQQSLHQYEQKFSELNPVASAYDEIRAQISQVQKEKRNLLGAIKTPPPLLEVMRLFSRETPSDIRLTEFQFHPYTTSNSTKKRGKQESVILNYDYQITIKGQVSGDYLMGDVVLINFINRLERINYFKQIKLTNKNKNPNSKEFSFELTAFR